MYCGGEEKKSAAPGGRGACVGRCYIDRTISTGGEARNTIRWGSIVYLGFFFGFFFFANVKGDGPLMMNIEHTIKHTQ